MGEWATLFHLNANGDEEGADTHLIANNVATLLATTGPTVGNQCTSALISRASRGKCNQQSTSWSVTDGERDRQPTDDRFITRMSWWFESKRRHYPWHLWPNRRSSERHPNRQLSPITSTWNTIARRCNGGGKHSSVTFRCNIQVSISSLSATSSRSHSDKNGGKRGFISGGGCWRTCNTCVARWYSGGENVATTHLPPPSSLPLPLPTPHLTNQHSLQFCRLDRWRRPRHRPTTRPASLP